MQATAAQMTAGETAPAGVALAAPTPTAPSAASSINTPQLQDYAEQQAVFADLDADGSGFLDEDEIWEWVAEKDEDIANDLMSRMDTNGDGVLDFNEFLEVWRLLYGEASANTKQTALQLQSPSHASNRAGDSPPSTLDREIIGQQSPNERAETVSEATMQSERGRICNDNASRSSTPTGNSSAAVAPGEKQHMIKPLDSSNATHRNRPELDVTDDDLLELCSFDLSLVEFHKTLVATAWQESAATAAATRLQACFRGHRWRSSGELRARRNRRVSGRGRRRPTANDPEFRRALAISPSLLLNAAFKQIDRKDNGQLTRDDLQSSAFSDLLTSRWHKLDADQSGVISREEWNAYFAKLRTRAIAKAGATEGEQQYHRFVAVLVWQAMVDLSSIEARVRGHVARTPATPANACVEVAALALKSMEVHAENEHVVQAAQKLTKLLAS